MAEPMEERAGIDRDASRQARADARVEWRSYYEKKSDGPLVAPAFRTTLAAGAQIVPAIFTQAAFPANSLTSGAL
jgi:hypothetical protein